MDNTTGTMGDSSPLVSVIITTYNRPDKLNVAIKSVIAQTYKNIELIVVDDSSDYDVSETIKDFSDQVQLYVNNENRGANWSRARGISIARGKYVCFLDDDDIWIPTKVEEQVDIAEQSTHSNVAVFSPYLIGKNVVSPPSWNKEQLVKSLLLGRNPLGGFSMIMVSYELITNIGLPDIHLSNSQDLEWYIRIAQKGDVKIGKQPVVVYNNEGSDRITSKKKKDISDDYEKVIEIYSEVIEGYGHNFRKRVESRKHHKLARYALESGQFATSKEQSLIAIRHNPTYIKSYILLLISSTGPLGYRISKTLRDKIPIKLSI